MLLSNTTSFRHIFNSSLAPSGAEILGILITGAAVVLIVFLVANFAV